MCVNLRITKFFYWLHLVYNTGYHQPMRWLRAMLLRLEQWRLMMPCASAAPRCGACWAGVTAPDAVRGNLGFEQG